MTTLSIVVVDDHPMFVGGLRALLETEPELRLAGVARNGEEALEVVAREQPDVVLMDLQMPGMSGVEATRRILREQPDVAVLVLTMFDDDHSVFAALRAGARGYLLKDTNEEELVRAVRAVGDGEAIFGAAIANRLIDFFAAREPTGDRDLAQRAFPQLTDREREILELVAAGLSNTDITRRLVLSPKTVRNHVSNIFGKLQVASRAEAIVAARKAGLG
jgi:DNA-binding NarL/FixJ family response regulator